ncbi:hypothetical protein [Symbioplanes lichenis]|uniref:hypothetical protein n=1 Tax=Symbioplanes lichenis TaxID=1629072 RepID=UPI0027399DDD|nr:hypothetical protein [Actinoplanes lichenis]
MSSWILVPCLAALRAEFNGVAARRDKGADGSIGDAAHSSSSDHTPDEDSRVLRGRDADSRNEVHALDVDATGPWPRPGWFGDAILALVAREKAEFESPDVAGRLEYVIWNGHIYSRSRGWRRRVHTGADRHTSHAHFSARYATATENDTRPWGVLAAADREESGVSKQDVIDALKDPAGAKALATSIKTVPELRAALAWAVLAYDPGFAADGRTTPTGSVRNLTTKDPENPTVGAATALERAQVGTVLGYENRGLLQAVARQLGVAQKDLDAIERQVAAVPAAVVERLGDAKASAEDLAAALRPVLGDRAAAVGRLLSAPPPKRP